MFEPTEAYVREQFGDLPQERINSMIDAMRKYGNKTWWESKDPVQLAKYQIFENVILSDFSEVHKGLEIIVGRPIFSHELNNTNIAEIREEVKLGLKRMELGVGTSQGYKETAMKKSIEMLETQCKKTGTKVIKVNVSGSQKNY